MVKSDQFFGQKILVTGASGFIGPHLCRKLSKYGADVYAISRTGEGFSNNSHIRWSRGDFSDIATVRTLLTDIKPDVIFHLAGHAAGGRELELVLPTYHSNLTTTVNLLLVATEIGCDRIILPASLEEPDVDDLEVVPSSPYAAGKWASSAYARMFHKLYGTPVVILRVFMTYGVLPGLLGLSGTLATIPAGDSWLS
jgi:UDP-glucose 4-epimerase